MCFFVEGGGTIILQFRVIPRVERMPCFPHTKRCAISVYKNNLRVLGTSACCVNVKYRKIFVLFLSFFKELDVHIGFQIDWVMMIKM